MSEEKEWQVKCASLESRLKEVSNEKDGCIRLLQIANDNQRKELLDKDAEIQRVNQHAFQREESLKKRLQLMGEKVAEFRKIEAFKIFEKNQSLSHRLSQALRVGYKCEHIAKNEIGGDCVHCNLVVAEGSVLSLQKRLSQAEADNEALRRFDKYPDTQKGIIREQAMLKLEQALAHEEKLYSEKKMECQLMDIENAELKQRVERHEETIRKITGSEPHYACGQRDEETLAVASKKLQECGKRISHLMDVAGKMAEWINGEVNYRDGLYCKSELGTVLLASWQELEKK